MYNDFPRENVQIYAPSLEKHSKLDVPTIKPVEWSDKTRFQLIESARIIRKRKEEIGMNLKPEVLDHIDYNELRKVPISEINKQKNKRQKLSEDNDEDSKMQYVDGTDYNGNILSELTPYKLLDHMIDPNQD
jgi:hypothetical protein